MKTDYALWTAVEFIKLGRANVGPVVSGRRALAAMKVFTTLAPGWEYLRSHTIHPAEARAFLLAWAGDSESEYKSWMFPYSSTLHRRLHRCPGPDIVMPYAGQSTQIVPTLLLCMQRLHAVGGTLPGLPDIAVDCILGHTLHLFCLVRVAVGFKDLALVTRKGSLRPRIFNPNTIDWSLDELHPELRRYALGPAPTQNVSQGTTRRPERAIAPLREPEPDRRDGPPPRRLVEEIMFSGPGSPAERRALAELAELKPKRPPF